MKNLSGIIKLSLVLCLAAAFVVPALGQKIETVNGVRIVHNRGEGIWAKSPRIALEKIRAIGDIEAESEEVAFYMPLDMSLDAEGNLYVLDTGNHRIQKFSPEGVYLATIGRQGQGPGEFTFPGSLDVDGAGGLIVASPYGMKIQFLDTSGVERGSGSPATTSTASSMPRATTCASRSPRMGLSTSPSVSRTASISTLRRERSSGRPTGS
jgi:hypothetical protein